MAGSPYPEAGAVLGGRYTLLREIGRGGFSIVYAAHDQHVGGDVAIKLLVPPPAAAQVARERMRRETQAARALVHPNIVAVHDFADDGGWSFIVMELVDGCDLQVRVRSHGPLSPDQAVGVGRDIAAALSVAHHRGILHRDVKPQNILLDGDGRARLTDFGSARLDGVTGITQTGAMVGTVPYTAPEVLAGRRGDARADVYSLGVTLFEALAGHLPRSDADGDALPGRAVVPPPDGFRIRAVRRDVPPWLDEAIARATAAAPGQRFPTADSLGDALTAGGTAALPPVAAPLTSCVLCGEPDPFGLTICARCGGTSSDVADTIVYVRRLTSGGDRGATLRALDDALGPRARSVHERVGPLEDLPLLRVPSAIAGGLTGRLQQHGLAVRSLPVGQSWRAVPGPLLMLLGVVLGAGVWTGLVAMPNLLWTSPIVAGLLFSAATIDMRRPALADDARASSIPRPTRAQLLSAIAALPAGEARRLLARAVQLAEPLFAAIDAAGDATDVAAPLRDLLSACADIAVDIARLDDSVAAMHDAARAGPPPDGDWDESLARCERARDAMIHRLLAAIATLGRLHGQTARLAEVCAPAVDAWNDALVSAGNAAAAAADDVAAAIGAPSAN